MAGIKVSLKGAKELRKNLNSYQERVGREIAAEVQKTALKIESGAKKRAPVDTGRLRASIGILERALDGQEAVVGTRVDYAATQERRRPYLEPAAVENKEQFEAALAKIIKDK